MSLQWDTFNSYLSGTNSEDVDLEHGKLKVNNISFEYNLYHNSILLGRNLFETVEFFHCNLFHNQQLFNFIGK
jgi:hypothetical protein